MSEDSKLCTAAYFADECGPEIRLCGKGESAAAVLDDNAELFCCFRDPLSCALVTAGIFTLGITSTFQWQKTVRASGVVKSPVVLFLTYYICAPFYSCVGASGRTLLETRAGMNSDYDANVMTHCWCHPCALCQEARALKMLTAENLANSPTRVMPQSMEMGKMAVQTQVTI